MHSQSPLYQNINEQYGPVKSATSLNGGDISEVYNFETPHQNFVLKTSCMPQALDMFQKESAGLDAIARCGIIKTPQVFEVNRIDNQSFILMEYIETQSNAAKSQAELGRQLAQLHSQTQSSFGWKEDNYIGSLVQKNSLSQNWIDFYAQYRLKSQLDLAIENGYFNKGELPGSAKVKKHLENYIGEVKPSLLHGDLWSENFLTDLHNIPVLIDPAVYLGHNEVDLAMTRLFGGFSNEFYNAYNEILPMQKGWQERQEIYQLYYLLVHLNLFGASYLAGVRNIISKYFN